MRLRFGQDLSFKLCSRLADCFPTPVGFACSKRGKVGPPPRVIWLRFGNRPTNAVERALRDHADAIMAFEQDTSARCLEIY